VPTHVTKIAIFYRKSEGLPETNFSQKVVGIHRGIILYRDILQKFGIHESTLHKLPSNDVLFEMLALQRFDVVVTSKDEGEYILRKHHSKIEIQIQIQIQIQIEKLVIDDYQLPVYLAFRKGVVDIKRVNEALLKVTNSNRVVGQPE
jgi:ABC-type amino acid transport substrate-binding protein